MKLSTPLAVSLSLLTAGCQLAFPPTSYASESSCQRVLRLEATPRGVVALVREQTLSTSYLGRATLSDGNWRMEAPVTRTASHVTPFHAALSPQGDGFVAVTSDYGDILEIYRTVADGWQSVPFAPLIDSSVNTLVHRTVALSERTAAVQVSAGTFVFEDGAWTEIGEPTAAGRGPLYHRGPVGELWALNHPSESSGVISFHAWDGSAWTTLPQAIDVTALGMVYQPLAFHQGTAFAVYELGNTGPIEMYAVTETGATLLSRGPADVVEDYRLTADSVGRPILLWMTPRGGGTGAFLQASRLEDGRWRTLHKAETTAVYVWLGGVAVDGDDLVVSWTESSQPIDTGKQHFTDCDLNFVRSPL